MLPTELLVVSVMTTIMCKDLAGLVLTQYNNSHIGKCRADQTSTPWKCAMQVTSFLLVDSRIRYMAWHEDEHENEMRSKSQALRSFNR